MIVLPQAQGVVSANWIGLYSLASGNPAIIMDFANNRYYDGTTNRASISDLMNGTPSRNSSGLLTDAATLTAKGAFLTACQAGTVSFAIKVSNGSAASNGGLISFDLTQAPVFQASTNAARSYTETGPGNSLDTGNTATWTGTNYICSAVGGTTDSSGRRISLNGGTVATGTQGISAPVTSVPIGSFAGTFLFGGGSGRIAYIVVWTRYLSSADVAKTAVTPPWN